ncbi:hypothetical protein POSPLADRAFT_1042958 [Postia placenta MAD-698-R-SB12]|uniref:Endoplasmic reticulum protein n=1 Tax=Postia placenta MAD-698-R-SB12 TaxID=670580 RepID=A0A1X6NHB9_9APHY|nr:hypothetical protein POSPLADRAFT_1042958 [Postia placenta MAD-698-R-SB12]OSX67763.1 hypothetical protein POSPLADRAFT_1042958 [Postia placenta MAD-698-R-SB12]
MATTQHYLWASGHFILLLSSLRYFLATVMFRGVSTWWYKASFLGALVSYAIQAPLGPPVTWVKRFQHAAADENVQYFMLAFFWWSMKPITIALVPYTVFSLFHALTFTRTNLMPRFLPPGPPPTAGAAPTPHPLAKTLHAWVKANYDTAMKVVAFTELVIMVRVTVGAVTFQNSLLSPVIYAHFLRARYYQSKFTQNAVAVVTARVDGYVGRPGTHPQIVNVWTKVKLLVERWVGSVLEQQPAPGRR